MNTPRLSTVGRASLTFDAVRRRCPLPLDTDYTDEEVETSKRYKPRSLDELTTRTKFSKKEIQLIYQGFKQECPSGMRVSVCLSVSTRAFRNGE